MVSEQLIFSAGWASWGSIFASGLTALAVSIVMALFGVALGFAVVKPESDDPVSGLGIAFSGWSFISVVVSLACGGVIAGLFSGQRGLEHGFMVWALVTVVACGISGIAISSAVKAVGIALKNIGSGAAGAISTAGEAVSDMLSGVLSELREDIDLKVDTDKISDSIMGVLRDTGVESLQPERLQKELHEARMDFKMLLRQLALRPTEYNSLIARFLDTEKSRLETLAKGVDRDAAVTALMRTRNIPQQEAETMVDNAMAAYQQAVEKARQSLAEAKAQVNDLKKQLEEAAIKARDTADRFSSAAAKVSLAAGAAVILAAGAASSRAIAGPNTLRIS